VKAFVKRKDNWTVERVEEAIGDKWEIVKFEPPLLLKTTVTCKCKDCDSLHSTRLTKFLEGRKTLTRGCPHCHKARTRSKAFSEERSAIASRFMNREENRKKWSGLLKNRWEEDYEGMVDTCVAINNGSGRSEEEKELEEWVASLGLEVEHGSIDGLCADLIIHSKKVLIEYNGLWWHCERHKDRRYHLNKTKKAKELGYRLIHVWSDQWLFRREQTKNFIMSALGCNSVSVGARKCSFKLIESPNIWKEFFESTHIQGVPNNVLAVYGAYFNGELVGACSYSRHHRRSSEIVLSRLSFKEGVSVAGALSKFTGLGLSLFKSDISTWVHLTLSDGNSYLKSGWTLQEVLSPDYAYTDGKRTFSKQSRRKRAVQTPPGMTEKEHATVDGLYRVWDCGKLKLRARFAS
jgi:very-short-patch-repair endonuclease